MLPSRPVAKLEFFWDVGSAYTYLATTQLAGLRERTGAEVVLRPFLLGGLFKSVGNSMPASVPAKAMYMKQDLVRWRTRYGVKMLIPPEELLFPINSLVPMRIAVAIDDPAEAERYLHAIMAAYWTEGLDVGDAENVRAVLVRHRFDADSLFAAIGEQAVKDRLRRNTDEAAERGAFGAPTMFVGDQIFWGNDRLDFVEEALAR